MQNKFRKKLIFTLFSLCCTNSVLAANAPTQQSGGASNAIAFGVQAGQIAGSAQGCGIDISTFTTRAGEAINKLAVNQVDSGAATAAFQQALQQSQIYQRNNNPMPCSQVMQNFNSLPLLKPDYEQSVIAQLSPGMESGAQSNNATTTNAPTSTSPNNNAATGNNNQASSTTANNQTEQAADAQQNNSGAGRSNQQQGMNNSTMQNNNSMNNNNQNSNVNNSSANKVPPNPAYPQQSYGPMKSFSNTYSSGIKPYGMNEAQQQNVNGSGTMQPANNYSQQNNNYQQQNNNPAPPNFSNPNNAPPTNNAYPNP